MRLIATAMAAIVGVSASSAVAQEFQPYSESLDDSARQVRERMLRDTTVNRRRSGLSGSSISANTRRTCASRHQMAARYGRDRPDIRKLYALCVQARL